MLETKVATISSSVLTIAAFGFTAKTLLDANRIIFSIQLASAVATWDGATDPTATLGMYLKQNTLRWFVGNENINNMRFIRAAAVDVEITAVAEKL